VLKEVRRNWPWWSKPHRPHRDPKFTEDKVMARRGRKPTGAQLVEHLQGSQHAKDRLKAILETLSGQRTIPEACAELGIRGAMFHRVRSEVLQTALGRLEPRPQGRPSRPSSAADQRVAELEGENLKLKAELKAAEVRRELAENLPRLATPGTTRRMATERGKKTTQSKTSRRRKRLKRSSP
jgi:hypothetical protein